MVLGGLSDLGERPVNSGGSANIYKATYKGGTVAVKVLKARRSQAPDIMHKVRSRSFKFNLAPLTRSSSDWSGRWSGGRGSDMKISCRSLASRYSKTGSRWSLNGSPMVIS